MTILSAGFFSDWRRLSRTRYLPISGLILAAIFVGPATAAEPQSLVSTPVYATLQSSGWVENLQTGATLTVPGAHYNAVGLDGQHLLVSEAGSSRVHLLTTVDGKTLATFDVGPVAQGVVISPDNQLGLAVGAGDGTITVIDLATKTVHKVISVGNTPHNVCFSANGKQAFVTLQGGGSIAVLDMQTLEKTDEFSLPGMDQPHNLALSEDGKTLWIRDFTHQVAAVDLSTHKILATISVGQGHAGIAIVPGSRYVVTGAMADDHVDIIDATTFKVVKRIAVGLGSHGVRASQDGRLVYVGVSSTDQIAVIDMQTLEMIKQLPLKGQFPFWLALSAQS